MKTTVQTAENKTNSITPTDPYKILAVDDDEAQRRLVRQVLRPPRFFVTEAEEGESALGSLESGSFDAILLDYSMPGMSGLELCQIIRANPRFRMLPIVMVTGRDGPNDLVNCLSAGADDFIRKPFSPPELVARVSGIAEKKRLVDHLDDADGILMTLARLVEARDNETGDHCGRLVGLGSLFADVLGLDSSDRDTLRRAAFLHDLGKIAIPDSILLKNGPLSDEEWVVMRKHPEIGAELCAPLTSMHAVASVVRHHHERWDGSGYPYGLAGENIPYLARVFQIIDLFDALASARPYKPAWPLEKVLQIMGDETAQGKWDPKLMAVFLDMLAQHPEYSQCEETLAHVERCLQTLRSSSLLDGTRFSRAAA